MNVKIYRTIKIYKVFCNSIVRGIASIVEIYFSFATECLPSRVFYKFVYNNIVKLVNLNYIIFSYQTIICGMKKVFKRHARFSEQSTD